MSAPIEHLLLYGTLCRTEPAHASLGLDTALRFVGMRALVADLHDFGEYPGLVPGPGTVHAELYRIMAPGVVAALDRHEGCDEDRPERALFRRMPWPVTTERGDGEAWIYVYARPPADAPLIPGGSWARHRHVSRATPRSR